MNLNVGLENLLDDGYVQPAVEFATDLLQCTNKLEIEFVEQPEAGCILAADENHCAVIAPFSGARHQCFHKLASEPATKMLPGNVKRRLKSLPVSTACVVKRPASP